MEHTHETTNEAELFSSPRFIPVELAALNLQISKRQLSELLTAHGFCIYSFGQRSKRVAESDLKHLIRAAAGSKAEGT